MGEKDYLFTLFTFCKMFVQKTVLKVRIGRENYIPKGQVRNDRILRRRQLGLEEIYGMPFAVSRALLFAFLKISIKSCS